VECSKCNYKWDVHDGNKITIKICLLTEIEAAIILVPLVS
jgi:hypothetical protein